LLEQAHGHAVASELVYLSRRRGQEVRIHQSDDPGDEICLLFGRNPGRMERVSGDALEPSSATPARLTAYDAPLELDSITVQMRENLDDELTEVKSENSIDRLTAQALARTLERVPAGAKFRVRFVLDILCAEDRQLVAPFVAGIRLLEDDSLGGGGSRGSGRVRFSSWKLSWRNKAYYTAGGVEETLASAGTTAELQAAVADQEFSGRLA
jgi:CRISPR-associated protein Csm3